LHSYQGRIYFYGLSLTVSNVFASMAVPSMKPILSDVVTGSIDYTLPHSQGIATEYSFQTIFLAILIVAGFTVAF